MDMKRKFLERFFSVSWAANLRKDICGIKQGSGESLYEYWNRFNKLISRCPQHQISEQLIIQYFYEGLTSIDMRIIDAASGGALMNKTPREAWELLNDMAMNSQQFGPRDAVGVKEVIGVSSPTQQQLNESTAYVRKLAVGNAQVKPCGICASVEHHTDACPTLTREVEMNVARFDGETTPIFNIEIRISNPLDSSNHRDSNHLCSSSNNGPCPKLLVLQETRNSIKSLEDQMSQVVKEVREMKERERGKLPAQTHINPKNVSSMILHSGKELEGPKVVAQKEKAEEEIEKEIEQEANKLAKLAKSGKDKEIMEMFKKVQLSIPLLDAIKQVPHYAKFLKKLCTKKKKLRGDEKLLAGEIVSAICMMKILLIFHQFWLDALLCTHKIDVRTGTLTMEFEGVMVHINIFDESNDPVEPYVLYCVDVLDENV
ncbi:uncharacterized protein LOC127249177 [Andrographis paniculata]|uniref:uncharacterized protein LOC127249177 n=1 Tax=Andrographis paniculata TaxID=175694 RepID=UPI0021E7A4E6|nr:uncharacterized protein LOC127249177 [Andrographis paniculata]